MFVKFQREDGTEFDVAIPNIEQMEKCDVDGFTEVDGDYLLIHFTSGRTEIAVKPEETEEEEVEGPVGVNSQPAVGSQMN